MVVTLPVSIVITCFHAPVVFMSLMQILLLAGALEYHRVANKLSSFDTLLDQVGGFFGHCMGFWAQQ